MWRHFPSSLWFLLLNLVGHIKRCLHKNIGNILWFSFGDMTVPFQKTMYRHCDLDPWPMKVKLFLSIDYDPISVLYQIQSDMSTNSREIKYQNIEKSLSLIIEWLVSMATKKIRRFDFHDKFLPWFSDQNASAVKKSGRSDQYWGLYIVQLRTNGDRQTNRGDQYTLQKSTILQSNKVKRRRIVIKTWYSTCCSCQYWLKKVSDFWDFFWRF